MNCTSPSCILQDFVSFMLDVSFEFLYICAIILLLFRYQLLLFKTEVVLHNFALEHVHFFILTSFEKV